MIQSKKASDRVENLNARAERAQRRDVVSAAARRIVERLESRTMLSAVSEDALPAPYLPPQHDLVNLNGFLSGPSTGQALQIAQDYLHAHAASLGVSAADLDSASVTDQYTDTDTGLTHIYMRQTLNDLPVANANLVINVTRDGRVLNVAGGFVPGLGESQTAMGPVAVGTAASPAIDAVQGLQDAVSDLGLTLTGTPSFVQGSGASGADADGSAMLSAPGVSSATVPAALQYVWTPTGVTLSWDLQIQTTDGQHWYDVNVDATGATSGMVLANDWVDHASYNVMQLPNESANEGTRSIVTDPNDTTMSPFGWHDTNGVAGAEYTITRGNNVYAYTDTSNTNTPGFSPDGTSALNFNFAWDTTQSPSTTANQSAAVTNLFYLNNTLHDIHARYGFTEAAGNFQTTDYTGLGAGNDPVLAEAQDGGGTNNANFATPADGSSPRMQMYLWTYATPSRDGDLDNGIVIHEYGHGVSNRLTGGPANANALTATQSGGMGEGWSDWWALMLTQRPTDLQNSAYPMGTWALNQAATGPGIRRYPYSYNTSIDPETFALYGGANGTEVHNTGELWATTLWDMNWQLIQKYGFGANVAAGYDPSTPGQNGGNELALKLVMDGLKLQPANPSFVDARNAIIAADQALNGGQDLFQIWTAFARRGLGYSAVDTSSSATSVTTATDLPVGLLNPRVTSQSPSGVQTSAVSSLDFTFSKAMDPTSFNVAADVASFTGPGSVDLKSAITGFSWLNSNTTLHVTFTPQSTDGTYKMVIGPQILSADNGSAMDQDGDGTVGEPTQDQYTGTLGFDSLPLAVASTTPANGSLVSLPFTSLDVKFNEPYDPATIGTSDLTLSQGTVTNAAVVDATTVRYTLSGIVSEGALAVSMAAGALNDTDGFPMVAYSGSFATDIGTRAMPATTGLPPAGSLIYQTSSSGAIGTASDVDNFTINLDPGQTITVVITGVTTLQPTVSVSDALSAVIGSATAVAAGNSVILETLPVTTAGTYTIAVGGAGGSVGAYTVNVTLNAAQEAETFGGATNDTRGTAQNIDGSFASLGGSADRGAVVGALPTATGVPTYTDNFDTGTLGAAWGTYSSDAVNGHVFLSGAYGPSGSSYALLMDHNDSTGATYNLDEAVWTVDLTGRTQATLSFSQTTFSDENDALPADFTGHANGDGVSISNDGTHWHTVWQGDSTAQNPTWGAVSLDLAAAATAAGMTLGPNFKIKFQQYDNYNITTDGRGFDNVAISIPAAANDWYSLTLSAGVPATFAVAKAAGSAGETLALYDSGGTLVASGAAGASNVDQSIASYVAPASGTYYVQVSGATGNSYALVVTRRAAFDLEPNGSGSPQSLAGRTVAIGSVSTSGGSGGAPTTPGTTYTGAKDFTGTLLSLGIAADGSFVGPTIGAKYNGVEYLRQGTYLAGFTVAFNGVAYTNDIAAVGSTAFPVTLQDFSSGTLHGVRATGTINAVLGFQRTIWWNDGDAYALVYTTLTNNSATTVNTVAILDNQDPDPGGTTSTVNDVVIDANGHLAAGSVTSTGSMALASLDSRAAASIPAAFTVTDPFSVINSPVDPNGSSGDYTLNLAFNIGTLAAGQSATTGFAMVFGASQAAVQSTYAAIASKTVAVTADDDRYSITLAAGQTVSMRTQTPGDGAGQFVNTLNPALDLLDSGSNVVATNDNGGGDGRNAVLTYTAPSAGTYVIRVYAVANTGGEYVLSLGDGLTLGLPANANETAGSLSGTITASSAPASDLTITLVSSDPGRLSVPATVVVPAGQTSVSVPISVIDNNLLDGPEAVSITASAAGYFGNSSTVTIHDDETTTLSVLLPATATEGVGTITGTVTAAAAPTNDITVQLASSRTSRLTVPASVVIKAGQTSATFAATILNNTVIDGTQDAVVSASVENWTSGSATVSVVDNDNTIAVTMPTSGWEGQALSGTVTIGGTLSTSLVVNLASNDTTELTVPSTVTIAAGATSATFTITLPTDALKDGSQTATLTASVTGLSNGTANIVVHDANLDHVTIDAITGPKTAGTAFSTTARAFNIASEAIATYASTGTLSATGQGGSEPVSPTSATFSAGVWTGNVTLTVADAAVALTMTTGGVSATSNAFVVQPGAVASYTWGAVTSPQIANVPFAETLIAKDTSGNVATNFNGTVALSSMVGTTTPTTILNGITYTGTYTGTITSGWAFTPNTTVQVTAVRSYWGSKVSIWTDAGTLLVNQAVTGPAGTWTETPLTTPITLTAGTRYRIGDYSNGLTTYYRTDIPTFSWGAINALYSFAGDGFPSSTNSFTYLVDLKANIGAFTTVPVTPTTATFTNGVWTGNVTVPQGATAMHLHAADASSHGGDSANFDVVQRTLTLSLPSDVREDDGTVNGLLTVGPTPNADLVVTLASSDPSRLSVPATITIPAGQTSVSLPLTILDNNLLDGLEGVTITATASTYSSAPAVVNVHDNETAVLSVSLPTTAKEGVGTVAGTITASAAPTVDTVIQLTSSKPGRATVPATVTLKAGQTTASFNVTILDNAVIDGDTLVSIGAAADNWTGGFKSIAVQDNDNMLTFTLPTSGWEGQTLSGSVAIGGTLGSDLIVNLSSLDATELTLPATVTIPAGQKSATFTATLPADGIKDGTQTANVTANASGMVMGNGSVAVHDVDVDHLSFDPITGTKTAGTAFGISVGAYNIAGEIIAVFAGTGSLTAAGTGGSLPVTPASVTFASGVASTSVTLTAADPAVSLTVSCAGSTAGSASFGVQSAALSSFAWGPISSPQVVGIPFPAAVTAKDAYGNTVSSFSGTINLSGLAGGSTPSPTILFYQTSNNHYFQTALTGLGLTYTTFTSESAFSAALSAATPGSTLAIVDAPGAALTLSTTSNFVAAGGRMILDFWNLQAFPAIATSFGASVASSFTIPIPVYNWGGSSFFAGISSPQSFIETSWGIDGDYLQPLSGATAVAGFQATASANQAAIIIANFGRTILDGFLLDDAASSTAIVQFAKNEIQAVLPQIGTPVSITPASAKFTNGVWTGNVTVTQVANNVHLHADDGSGHIGDSNTFDVIGPSATPGAPDLQAASDSGASATDNLTNLNNSTAGKALQFQVAGVTSGATVKLYADGVLVGSAVASSTTVTLTTNGTTVLSDGPHVFTARQTVPGQLESADSSPLTVKVDTLAPTLALGTISPDPRTAPVDSDNATFSEAIAGLTKAGMTLTRDGGGNLLDGSQTLGSADNVTWTLGNLTGLTGAAGQYVLTIAAAGITDLAGNPLVTGATAQWTTTVPTPPTVTVVGTSGDDQIYFGMDGSSQNLLVWVNATTTGAPTATYPVNAFTRLVIDGGGGNDTITLDLSNGPIPAADGIAIDGGSGGSVGGGDSLVVVLPASGGAVSVGASSLTLGGVVASYADLASVVIYGGAGDDSVTQMAQPGAMLTFAGGAGNDTLNVNGGSFTLPNDAAGSTANLSINVGTGGAVAFGSSQHLTALNIGGTGWAVMAAAASAATPNVLNVGSLVLGGSSALELNNNEFVATVGLSYIETCIAGGNIRASAAGMFVGYLDLGGGQAEVRATLGGDTNLDGKVDVTDLGNLASAYGMSGGATWVQGDSNDDGHVDVTDLGNLASNYGADLAAGPAAAAMSQVAAPAATVFADTSVALPAGAQRPSSATLAATSSAWADDPEALMAEARRRRLELLA